MERVEHAIKAAAKRMIFYIDAAGSHKVDKECVVDVGGCDFGHNCQALEAPCIWKYWQQMNADAHR
jgi:hypothetical protein